MNKIENLLVAAGIGAVGGLIFGLVLAVGLSAVFGSPGEAPSKYLMLGAAGAGGAIAHLLSKP